MSGDTVLRVDKASRAPDPNERWDVKIMCTYSRNPSADKKLKKNIYERYEYNGKIGPFAVICYVWDTGVRPFRFEILPHGNRKSERGSKVSTVVQPREGVRFGTYDESDNAPNQIETVEDYDGIQGSMDIPSSGDMLEGSMDAVTESTLKPKSYRRGRGGEVRFSPYKRDNIMSSSLGTISRTRHSGVGRAPKVVDTPLSVAMVNSKEKLECEVLALKKEKLRVEIHRMAADTDKLEAEREKIEKERKKIEAETDLVMLRKEELLGKLAKERVAEVVLEEDIDKQLAREGF